MGIPEEIMIRLTPAATRLFQRAFSFSVNSQSHKIFTRSGRYRNLHGHITAEDTRIGDEVSPIKQVGRGGNDIAHIGSVTEKAVEQSPPDFPDRRARRRDGGSRP